MTKDDYNTDTGLPLDEEHYECGLPKFLSESLERMKQSWAIIDRSETDYHWDIC